MSTPFTSKARAIVETRAGTGWLHRRDFGTCMGCNKDADYLNILDDALIPVCQSCACNVLHPGRPAADAPFAAHLCPGCQFTMKWAGIGVDDRPLDTETAGDEPIQVEGAKRHDLDGLPFLQWPPKPPGLKGSHVLGRGDAPTDLYGNALTGDDLAKAEQYLAGKADA